MFINLDRNKFITNLEKINDNPNGDNINKKYSKRIIELANIFISSEYGGDIDFGSFTDEEMEKAFECGIEIESNSTENKRIIEKIDKMEQDISIYDDFL